jgi:hypothetical protein
MIIQGAVTNVGGLIPIVGARVILAIGDREFPAMSTSNLGRFEHRQEENFPGQTLMCKVEKEKFETALIQHFVESDVITLTIFMQTETNDNSPLRHRSSSTTAGVNDKLAEVFKKHWAKILAGIALLVFIGLGLSTYSQPSITTFEASSLTVKRGEAVKLTWESEKASLVTLNGAKVALSGSANVTPTETRPYIYELKAKNEYGGSLRHIVVTVRPAPAPTVKFWVEPQQVAKNETAVLHWETIGATNVKINHGKVRLSGDQEVKINETQTYTLEAQNEDGRKAESLTLEMVVPPGPFDSNVHLGFKATRNVIRPGEDTTLSWDTGTVKDVELKQGDQAPELVRPKGELKVAPYATTTYALTGYPATGPPITRIVNIRVASFPAVRDKPYGDTGLGQANPRVSLNAERNSIQRGQSTQLTWEVENAKEVNLTAGYENEKSVPSIGAMQVTPNSTTTYILTARPEKGPAVKTTVTVRVTNDAAPFSTGGAAVEAEVVRVVGFTYILRIKGMENSVTADYHTNKDSNIGSGDVVTVRVDDGRVLEIKK